MFVRLLLAEDGLTQQVDVQPVAVLLDLSDRLAELLVPGVDHHVAHHGTHPGAGSGNDDVGQQPPELGAGLDLGAVQSGEGVGGELAELGEGVGGGLRSSVRITRSTKPTVKSRPVGWERTWDRRCAEGWGFTPELWVASSQRVTFSTEASASRFSSVRISSDMGSV